jgi:hypothetical protein
MHCQYFHLLFSPKPFPTKGFSRTPVVPLYGLLHPKKVTINIEVGTPWLEVWHRRYQALSANSLIETFYRSPFSRLWLLSFLSLSAVVFLCAMASSFVFLNR